MSQIRIIKLSIKSAILGVVAIFGSSLLFPGILPSIDEMRISGQQMFFSSIKAIHYTDATDNLDKKTIFKYLKSQLVPGDLIFSYREGFIVTDLINGKRKHASLYVGTRDDLIAFIRKHDLPQDLLAQITTEKKTDMLIIDSTDDGVSIRSMDELTYLNDILIARVNTSDTNRNILIKSMLSNLGKEYNYDFNMNDTSRIYCSQLIYEGLEDINIVMPYTSFGGRSFLYPQDIVDYIIDTGIRSGQFSIITAIKDIQTKPKFYTYDDIITIQQQKFGL